MKLMHWFCSLLVALTLIVGCSKPEEDPKAKEGESCLVDADCESGLACRADVCVVRAVEPDMGGTDGGENNGSPDMDVPPVEDEDYIISYILSDDSDAETLWVYDTANQTHTQVSPEGTTCRLGCWLTRDLTQFITTRSNGVNFDILTAPVNADLTVTEATQPIVEDVRRVEVHGNLVTYVREEDGENLAYYKPAAGGSEVLVGSIGALNTTEGDWAIDPVTEKAAVYNATLQTMDIKLGELGDTIDTLAYTIDSSNYQETSGSYFGGSIPTAFSTDGQYMALVTQKAPMDYNLCENASECMGPGQRCGRFGRCSAIEVAVHFIDLNKIGDEMGDLGTACSADSACGPVHTCDIPADTAVDQATCIPRRVVLGLPGQQMQEGQTGCALTQGNDDYKYTDVRGPITFGPDGGLYLTAARACGEFDFELTDILRLSPTSSDYSVVYGNPGKNFSADDCYDPVEDKIDVENCTIWIERAHISPEGNSIAFIGTNPNVIEPQLTQTHVDLWTVGRDGENHTWVGQHPERDVVEDLRVHPPR